MSDDHITRRAEATTNAVVPLEFDPNDYRHHLSEFDLNEEQQKELLQTLWHIMSTFVDIGWGVDTVQLILPQIFNADSARTVAAESGVLLESKTTAEHDHVSEDKKGIHHD